MRITSTDNYLEELNGECPTLDICESDYCPSHRLLYRTCETAEMGYGTSKPMDVSGDCPKCKQESEQRRYMELARNLP